MKKISVLVLILIVFNFICSNYVVYAETTNTTNTANTTEDSGSIGTMTMDEYKKLADEGKTTVAGNEKTISLQESDVGSASSIIGSVLTSMSAIVVKMSSKFTADGGFYYTESKYSAEKTGLFTVNSLIFGEYLMFNAKPYQLSTDLNPAITPSGITKAMDSLKQKGAEFSQFFKKVALALAVPMIVLAIIRAIMAKKASDLAAWKKILARWALCVFLIIFFLY